jgi:hypothetical protein
VRYRQSGAELVGCQIRRSAAAAKEPAPINTDGIATIPVRERGLEVGGDGEHEPRGSLVEGANLLRLTNQVEIGGLVVHDTPRLEARKRGEVNEMESVVLTEANVADQERRTGRQQLMTGFPEAGARRQIDDVTDPSTKSVESAIVRINQQGAMDHGTRRRTATFTDSQSKRNAQTERSSRNVACIFRAREPVLTLDWPERFIRKSAFGMTS